MARVGGGCAAVGLTDTGRKVERGGVSAGDSGGFFGFGISKE